MNIFTLITTFTLMLSITASCSVKKGANINNNMLTPQSMDKPYNRIRVVRNNAEHGYKLEYVFYVDDENVEIHLSPEELAAEKNSRKETYTSSHSKFTEELASREEKLRIELQAEYDKKLNQSVSAVTNSYIEAQSFFYKKQYNKALSSIKKTLSYAPDSATVLSLAGSIYYAAGYIDKSIIYWQKALQNDSSLSQVRDMLHTAKKRQKR